MLHKIVNSSFFYSDSYFSAIVVNASLRRIFRYWDGVSPVSFLNISMKWLAELNEKSALICADEFSL